MLEQPLIPGGSLSCGLEIQDLGDQAVLWPPGPGSPLRCGRDDGF